ncbi:MAG: hypothetical protein RIB60_05955 [Phycisphaerales bacterium]
MKEPKSVESVRVGLDAEGRPKRLRDEDAPSLDTVELMHDILLNGATYQTLLSRLGEPQAEATALDEIERFVKGMKPESPAEKLLAAQMLLQHAHIVQLIRRFSDRNEPTDVRALSGAIGAAMDVFRRQVEAWNRLRRPHMTVRALQANLAYQQIVQGREEFDVPRSVRERRETQAKLPADTRGAGIAPQVQSGEQAVGVQHGPTNR